MSEDDLLPESSRVSYYRETNSNVVSSREASSSAQGLCSLFFRNRCSATSHITSHCHSFILCLHFSLKGNFNSPLYPQEYLDTQQPPNTALLKNTGPREGQTHVSTPRDNLVSGSTSVLLKPPGALETPESFISMFAWSW